MVRSTCGEMRGHDTSAGFLVNGCAYALAFYGLRGIEVMFIWVGVGVWYGIMGVRIEGCIS